MKESDCDKTQIFYPKTRRCIKSDTKKAIEYLFLKGDKTINNLYEMVDGKIVRKCVKPKVRNPESKRCIKEKVIKKVPKVLEKEVIKKVPKVLEKKKKVSKVLEKEVINKVPKALENKPSSLGKKIEAIRKVRKALTPFVNRVSADIYHRNKYLILMRRELKNNHLGCIRVYKKNADKTFSYRIGNRIILKKRIGTDSVYGIVYLSEFREKEKKIFTFASKVYEFVKQKAEMELDILHKMTDIVRMDICPHFPILYGYVICKKIDNFDNDSFVKSNSKDKSVSQKIRKFPDLIKKNKKSIIITLFNELANGDLWNFIKKYGTNTIFLVNAIIQQFLSIMFFNYHTGRIHLDCHPGNFLYHIIKPGGYFHYNIFGEDFYLENIGILWVIWDFDLSKKLDQALEIYKYKFFTNDYLRVLAAYLPVKYNGYCENTIILDNTKLLDFTYILHQHQLKFFDKRKDVISAFNKQELTFNTKSLKDFIYSLPLLISNIKVDGKYYFLRKLPIGANIINKKPYTMTKEELFK